MCFVSDVDNSLKHQLVFLLNSNLNAEVEAVEVVVHGLPMMMRMMVMIQEGFVWVWGGLWKE